MTPSAENKSEISMARNAGTAVLDVGPARKVFADCVMRLGVKVPVLVTGVPADPVNKTPSPVKLTDVTVPPEAPLTADHVPSPRKNTDEDGVPVAGRSAMTIARTTRLPPLVARNSLFVRPVAEATASVPKVVIGEPTTVSQLGTVRATDVTVPVPANGKG